MRLTSKECIGIKTIILSRDPNAKVILFGSRTDDTKAECGKIDFLKKLSETEFDAVENLTSRFARLTDILINKVFRSLDEYELEP